MNFELWLLCSSVVLLLSTAYFTVKYNRLPLKPDHIREDKAFSYVGLTLVLSIGGPVSMVAIMLASSGYLLGKKFLKLSNRRKRNGFKSINGNNEKHEE